MGLSRRSFLKTSAAGAAVSIAGPGVNKVFGQNIEMKPGPGNKWPGRVVINYNKNAAAGKNFNTDVIKKMVDDSIMLLTEKKTIGEAWKALFPSLTPSTKIAIKMPLGFINSDSSMAPHWSSIKAIVDGLWQMDWGGEITKENIIIYDMLGTDHFTDYGYKDNITNATFVRDSRGTNYTDGAKGLQYATSLNKASYLINVFRPGGHLVNYEGFTLGFKNHFGTYDKDHSNKALGFLRDINCTGVVYNKTVLSVCIGLNGAKEVGGPNDPAIPYNYYIQASFDQNAPDPIEGEKMPPNLSANTIIMSTDPISAEMQTIKMMRLNKKPAGGYGVADMPKYLKASAGITGALTDATYNIGVIDETKMDIRKIINEEIPVSLREVSGLSDRGMGRPAIAVSHMTGSRSAFIEYRLPQSLIGSHASVEICDLNGKVLYKKALPIAGAVSHFSWDEKTDNGRRVSSGIYIVKVVAGKASLTGRLVIPG